MELYISDHPLDCLTCAANGDCELQDRPAPSACAMCATAMRATNHVSHGGTNGAKDESNPYFTYRSVEMHRLLALRARLRGGAGHLRADDRRAAASTRRVSAGMNETFIDSECVSCGACVQACPTATLTEKSVIEIGQPEHSVVTTCAYCGVGCSFKAEMRGDELVRMVPYKDGKANRGHSCVKGRFAWGYATHKERILKPMIREKITDPWREVSGTRRSPTRRSEFKRIQAKYGRRTRSAASPRRAAPTRRPISSRS